MTDTPTVPAGWYPDPNAPGGQRWWDGSQWTGHVGQQTQAYQAFAPLKAPEGTKTNTVWIWLVVLLPLLALPTLFLIDIQGYLDAMIANPTSTNSLIGLYTSPGYVLALVLGWGSTIATIVFAALDYNALKKRGVPQPFHWAFIFLTFASAGIVYPIGRSVVVKRRANGSRAPMWVAIAVYATILIVTTIWVIVVMSRLLTTISTLTPVS